MSRCRFPERLMALRTYLLNLPAGAVFDMNTWGAANDEPTEDYCGTAACALGWAATMPEFKAMGLSLCWEKRPSGNWRADVVMVNDDYPFGVLDLEAAVTIFGISIDDARWLFVPMKYRNSICEINSDPPCLEEVIDRMDQLLEVRVPID